MSGNGSSVSTAPGVGFVVAGVAVFAAWAYMRFGRGPGASVSEVGASHLDERAFADLEGIDDADDDQPHNQHMLDNHDMDVPIGEQLLDSEDEDGNGEDGEMADSDNEEIPENDRARIALEEAQRNNNNDAGEPQRIARWKQRGEVGAKKARSLARREQRRAYYEFVRQQADHEREQQLVEEQMFGDLIAEEQAERELRIEEARAELEERRQARRNAEDKERKRRQDRRAEISSQLATQGRVRLDNDEDRTLARELTGAILVANDEYALNVTPSVISALSTPLKEHGRVTFETLRESLESGVPA